MSTPCSDEVSVRRITYRRMEDDLPLSAETLDGGVRINPHSLNLHNNRKRNTRHFSHQMSLRLLFNLSKEIS